MSVPPSLRPQSAAAHVEPQDFRGWDDFLGWCVQIAGADTAFIADQEGFIVAFQGHLALEEFEGVGAELSYSMEQLDRLNPEPGKLRSIALAFQDHMILGFRVGEGHSFGFVLGLIGKEPLDNNTKWAIQSQAQYYVPRLT